MWELHLSPQHGDMNPRNILLTDMNKSALIDYARFGEWPVGYDVIRLELQVMLRMLSRSNADDSFPHHLDDWLSFWSEVKDGVIPDRPRNCDPAGVIASTLRMIADGRSQISDQYADESPPIARQLALLRCFDAIKMCSYQDATAFKRLFFLLVAVDCADTAGMMHD
jgi:hypothetical protein